MAEEHGYDTSVAGKMDYSEHEKTYRLFIHLVKFGTIWIVAILLGMMVALMTSAGFLAGIATFVLFGAVASYLIK